MVSIKRTYDGKLNMDISKAKLPPSDYTYAKNICRDSNRDGNDKAPSGTVGNRLVSYALPTGTNKVIGAIGDLYKTRIIDFTYNSNGNHLIRIFNGTTRTYTALFINKTNSGDVDILGWDASTIITSIDIIHRQEGDLLTWTDNGAPKKLNIDRFVAGTYGVIEYDFISAAKKMPVHAPTVMFDDDFTKSTNSLRKKLYQLKYRWVYDDFEKSTWSPISDIPLPKNIVANDNDLDSRRNNVIKASLQTGNKDVIKIEVAARVSNGSTWNDFQLVDVLDKAQLSIGNNIEYTHSFYNDGMYPAIDQVESELYFDWFPRKAKCQALVNGNVMVYGGITEGYNGINSNTLSVVLSVANVTNTGVSLGAPSLTYFNEVPGTTVNIYRFTVSGTVTVGTRYKVTMRRADTSIITLSDYTTVGGDTLNSIASNLYSSTPITNRNNYFGDNKYQLNVFAGDSILSVEITGGSGAGTIATDGTWNYNSKYRFGLVYFDAYGRTNGVVTNVGNMEINTPNIEVSTAQLKTPVISASINHAPPSWAVKYMWVRTKNLTFDSFLYYMTNDFQSDANYYYFGLENIKYFKNKNSQFNYSEVSVKEGDRLKVLVDVGSAAYGSNIYTYDYEVIGIEDRQLTGGSSTDLGKFVKVKKNVAAPSPAFTVNMMVMLYTPAVKTGTASDTVYYEFGKVYDIITSGVDRFHQGMINNQDATQPATFTWETGDIYYHNRTMYKSLLTTTPTIDLFIMDSNYNDFYKSSITGIGRPVALDPDAKEQYFPVTVRFSQTYVQDSNINGLNRFYYDNQDTYNRSFGDIERLKERDKQLRVFQRLKVGSVPVYQQIIKDAVNGDVMAQSDRLLNKIQYYVGDFGIGTCPESLASEEYADYFVDNTRGRICRLSRDGITPLSLVYQVNNWAITNLPLRGNGSRAYGVYDRGFSRYVLALEAATGSEAQTISFHEPDNCFECFHDLYPEFMVALGTMMCSYKNGALWTHDSSTYCNFFGVQYKPMVRAVYNDGIDFKKTFTSAKFVSSTKWYCPQITTSLGQSSSLLASDFRKREDSFTAGLLRDSLSPGGILQGDFLKGNWVEVDFEAENGSVFNSLIVTSILFKESNKNK